MAPEVDPSILIPVILANEPDAGFVEYANNRGLYSIVRSHPHFPMRQLQGLEMNQDVTGVLLFFPVARPNFPDARVFTAFESDGSEAAWLVPGEGQEPLPGTMSLADLAVDEGLVEQGPIDLAALRRFVTGRTYLHTAHARAHLTTWAIAQGTHDFLHRVQVADHLKGGSAARARWSTDDHLLVDDLRLADEPGYASGLNAHQEEQFLAVDVLLAGDVARRFFSLGEALRGPRPVLVAGGESDAPDRSSWWARLKQAVDEFSAFPWDAFDPTQLAKVLGLPEAVNADWWGAETLTAMALRATPVATESLAVLQEEAPVIGALAADRLSVLLDD
ncbi:MAG: hypothetical protein Q4G46_13895 [Propionibacteriaceae bacterium]|nr:hypothetical protein [Propionibacteriaceae bacterium]